jgi:uncharacterized protein YhaN
MSDSAKKTLRLKELVIREMPGFSAGMKPYDDFSEGINIIAGPNASGKSTTARAIQKLIWQNDTRGLKLTGQAELSGDDWSLRVNSGQTVVQRNGVPDEITGLPAAEDQNRYMLGLHDLLTTDGEDLARHIHKESAGGYDPEKAAEKLEYSLGIKSKRLKARVDYGEAEEAVRKSQEKQQSVKEEEEKLSDLQIQLEEAEESERRAEFFRLALNENKSKQAIKELQDQKDSFPSELDDASGHELGRIDEYESDISDAEEKIRQAEHIIAEKNNEINNLSIPESGVPDLVLHELDERSEKVKELENSIADLKTKQASFDKKRSQALNRIGETATEEKLRLLDLDDIDSLDEFLQRAHSLASEKRVLIKETDSLTSDQTDDQVDPETLQSGIAELSHWLKAVPVPGVFPAWIIITITVMTIITGVAGYFYPEAGLAGLVIIFLSAIYGLTQLRNNQADKSSDIRIHDFEATGLRLPESWDPDAVKNRLNELIKELGEAHRQTEIGQKLRDKSRELKELQGRIDSIESEADEFRARLSAIPDLPFDNPEGYSQLAWFIQSVQNWKEADAEWLAVSDGIAENNHQVQEYIQRINNLIAPYTESKVSDAAEAVSITKDLRSQEERRRNAEEEVTRQETALGTQRELIDKRKEDLKSIYEPFKLDPGDKDELRKMLGQLEEYNELEKELEQARREHKRHRTELQSHSFYAKEKDVLMEFTPDQLEMMIRDASENAAKLDDIKKQITQIQTKVDDVKKGHDIEDALKERDEAVERLRVQYDENLRSITGRLLADTLKEELQQQNMPKVFKEADRLFNRITKGRYNLKVVGREKPEFYAFDTVDGFSKSLDELSSGTRIQLLMAVRLAFVETQETSVKLPILADELLANSDDIRAGAIIDALTEISRDGRQVFYFTAQSNEVAKWEEQLSGKGIKNHKVFYLGGRESRPELLSKGSKRESIKFIHDVPEPGLMDHAQYGEHLNIPAFNRISDSTSHLHLWYLVSDPEILYECISGGIEFWGALENYLGSGGTIEGLTEDDVQKMRAMTDLLDRYLRLFRRGRPKPIDRSVLEDSDATRVDEVSDLMRKVDYNPQKLLKALRKSEVKGYYNSVIDRIEEYFVEHGYLDNREPMKNDEINTALQAFISNLSLSQKEAQDFINQF